MESPRKPSDKPAKVKYVDRPTDDGQHGDGAEEPNEGYPTEGLDPDSQRGEDIAR